MSVNLNKKKRIRSGHRQHVVRIGEELEYIKDNAERLKSCLENLSLKLTLIQTLDNDILAMIDDEEVIDIEINESSNFLDEIQLLIIRAQNFLKTVSKGEISSQSMVSLCNSNINLPKITLEEFDGNILNWRGFWEQFKTTIGENNTLSDIEKFTYLKRLLKGSAYGLIYGLTLTSNNYEKAITMLTQRYGNTQVLISTNMENLLKLLKVKSIDDMVKLRMVYDKLETSVRNLNDLGVEKATYGSMLINILFDRIPTELKIIISRKFKHENWNLNELIIQKIPWFATFVIRIIFLINV